MPAPKKPGSNKAITTADVAKALTIAAKKCWGERPLDVRAHTEACQAAGDDGAEAFLAAGGNDWWVPLLRDPSEENGRAVLHAPFDESPQDAHKNYERYLEVARRVPALRDAAMERLATEAKARLMPEGPGSSAGRPESSKISIGSMAQLDMDRARALVAEFPGLLETTGSLDHLGRSCGGSLYVVTLLSTDFEAGMAVIGDITERVAQSLPQKRYGLELSAEQWICLAKAATTAHKSYGQDWLLGCFASTLVREWGPSKHETALEVFSASEEPHCEHLELLTRLGHVEAATALLKELETADPKVRWAEPLALGLIDAEEARRRAGFGEVDGKPSSFTYKRHMTFGGLLSLSRAILDSNANDPMLDTLEKERVALADEGAVEASPGQWFPHAALHESLVAERLQGSAREAQMKSFVAFVKSDVKAIPARERAQKILPLVSEVAKYDALSAFRLAKVVPADARHRGALPVAAAFWDAGDLGGALIALCDLCPKLVSHPNALMSGTLEIVDRLLAE